MVGYRCTCLWRFLQPWFLPKNDIWNFKLNKISQYWYQKRAKGLNFSNLIWSNGIRPLMATESSLKQGPFSKSVCSFSVNFQKVLISNYESNFDIMVEIIIYFVHRCLSSVFRTKTPFFYEFSHFFRKALHFKA